jgi:hypothetical protein
MLKKSRSGKVLLYQSIGFLAIIAVCFFDEVVGLSSLILGNQSLISNFRETILKMLLILGVWLLVSVSTGRILAHMRYLEGLAKVCAWCRRIEHNGHWIGLEEFFQQGFDTPTTHGICQECLGKTTASMGAGKRSSGPAPKKVLAELEEGPIGQEIKP